VSNAKSGSKSVTSMGDGGEAASRIGFRGTEDLGGGNKVGFVLESGLLLKNGQGTTPGPGMAWTRQSFLNVSGGWGSLEMGRMYTPMFLSIHGNDPFGLNSVFSPLNVLYSLDAQSGGSSFAPRTNNMFRYNLPAGSALRGSIAWAPGDTTANTTKRSDFWGGNLIWRKDGLYLAYGFQRFRPGSEQPIVTSLGRTTYHALSAGYAWSGFRLTANYAYIDHSADGVPSSQVLALGGSYSITPASTLLAEAVHRKVGGSSRGQDVLTLGYDYGLSKRSVLYGRFLYLRNRGDASVSIGGSSVLPNSGDNARVIAVGFRHNF
jgi:predicted porin